MKKMTMPKQLKLNQVLWHTLILFLGMYASPLSAQVTNNLRTGALVERFDYAKVQDNTLSQLDAAASELASTLDSAFQIQDFKVFDFGLYLPTLSMSGELSFDQAVSNMYDRIETGGVIAFRNPTMPILRSAAPPAAYVLITHQFQGGGNVRFNMIVKIPGMSQAGADVSGVEKTLALAGQRAMEQAYAGGSGEDKVSAAKAAGLKSILSSIRTGDGIIKKEEGSGIVLSKATNFVTLSGKIIQLPTGAEVFAYCVDLEISNGVVLGFKIGDSKWVAKTDELSCSQCQFSGFYNLLDNGAYGTTLYHSSIQLTPGKLPISFLTYEGKLSGGKDYTMVSEDKDVTSQHIDPSGVFSGPKVSNPFSYNPKGNIVRQGYTTTECDPSSHPDVKRIKQVIENDIVIILEKGTGGQRSIIDADGKEIPLANGAQTNSKVQIVFTELNGKITGAKVTLNPQSFSGNPQDLAKSEAIINDAISKIDKNGHKGWKIPTSLIDGENGGEIYSADMSFMQAVTVVTDIGVSVYESASMPASFWSEQDGKYKEYPIHGPPLLCGVGDGVIEEVTEIPQLVKLGVDFATNPGQIVELWNSVKEITPSALVQAASGAIKEKWQTYTGGSNKPKYEIQHEGGKDAVVVVTLVATGLTLGKDVVDGIKETGRRIAQKLDDLLKKLVEKLSNRNLVDVLKKDLSVAALKDYLAANFDRVKIWELLQTKGKKNAKLKPEVLQKLELLPEHLRDLVTEFSDDASGSTLSKFCEALDDQSFLDYVNNPDNDVVVRGFLAHKEGIVSEEEARLLSEMLEKDEITHPKALEWMQRSKSYQKFKGYSEAGKAFEKAMIEALKDIGSAAYQALKNKVDDLDSRAILSQVQFCIKGDCINKGEYFVADLVLVSKKTDPFGAEYIEDIIVIDTKLSKSTDFTPNQKVANGLSNLEVKSISGGLVKGSLPNNNTFKAGAKVPKKGQIRKMYTNEAGEVFVD